MIGFEDARARLAGRLHGPAGDLRLPAAGQPATATTTALSPVHSVGKVQRGAIFVVGFYFIVKMMYVFDVGTAQPADMGIILLALVTVSPAYLMDFMKRETALTALVLWVMLVNVSWYLILSNPQFLMFITYYVFNLIIAVCVFAAYRRDRVGFERIIPIFIAVSVVIQAAYVTIDTSGGYRAYGTFANPNQLAYWAVTAITVLMVIRRNKVVWWDLPVILLALYCAVASVSRAGLIALILLAGVWAWFALETPVKRLTAGLAGALVLIAALFLSSLSSPQGGESSFAAVDAYEQRQAATGQRSMSQERNLDRVVDYYAYTVLGAGEGAYGRFEENNTLAIEIHSSFVTLLFSYGIIGFIAFLGMTVGLFLRLPLSLAIYQIPMLTYGFTHNGLRFSFYWIAIGLLMAIAWEMRGVPEPQKKARKGAAPEPSGTIRVPESRDSGYLRGIAKS